MTVRHPPIHGRPARLQQEDTCLAEIGRVMTSSLDMNDLYEPFAVCLQQIIPFRRLSISRPDEEKGTITTLYAAGISLPGLEIGDVRPLAGSRSQRALETRVGVIEQGPEWDEHIRQYPAAGRLVEAGLRSALTIPLIAHDRVVGIMLLSSDLPEAYSQRDVEFATRAGMLLAGALANAELYAERARLNKLLERSEAENRMLADIGRTFTSSLDIEEIYAHLSEQVSTLIPYDQICVFRPDATHGAVTKVWTLTRAYCSTAESAQQPTRDVFSAEGTPIETVMTTGAGVTCQGTALQAVAEVSAPFARLVRAGFQSALMVPLISSGRPLGVLALTSRDRNAYAEHDLALAERVGAHIAGAVANADLYAERARLNQILADREEESRKLAEISRIVSSSSSIEEVYDGFARQAQSLVPSDRVSVHFVNRSTKTVTVAYTFGMDVPGMEQGSVQEIGSAYSPDPRGWESEAFRFDAEDLAKAPPRSMPGLAWAAGIHSAIVAPLITRQEIIGVLIFASRAGQAYSERDLAMADRVAAQISGAIANAQLYARANDLAEALRQEEEDALTLAEIGRVISASTNIQEAYQEFAKQVVRLVPFTRIFIDLPDLATSSFTVAYVAGTPAPWLQPGSVHPFSRFPLPKQVIDTRTSRLVHAGTPTKPHGLDEGLDHEIELSSMILVPLIASDEVVGVLGLATRAPEGYTERDLRMAERVGNQIAGTIASARLHQERLRLQRLMAGQAKDLAVIQERERIARDIHDTLAQDFTGIVLQLRAAEDEIQTLRPELQLRLTNVAHLAQDGLRETRGVLHDLTSSTPDPKHLEAVLKEQIERFASLGEWAVAFEASGRRRKLAPSLQTGILRICQEALANVFKHARATAVRVTLKYEPNSIMLGVHDNGVGFDVENIRRMGRRAGFGVAGMEERARLLGGSLSLRSEPGKGTFLDLSLPLVPPEASERA